MNAFTAPPMSAAEGCSLSQGDLTVTLQFWQSATQARFEFEGSFDRQHAAYLASCLAGLEMTVWARGEYSFGASVTPRICEGFCGMEENCFNCEAANARFADHLDEMYRD